MSTVVAAAGVAVPIMLKAMAEISDEEDEVLRESVPSYLKTHTFFYTRLGGKLQSWDLTFVNPFAMMTDGGVRFWEYTKRGRHQEAFELLAKSFVGVPFLQGQIAAGAVYEAIADEDAHGKRISKVSDGPVEGMSRRLMHIMVSGYAPPTLDRLAKKLPAAIEGDRGDFLETPYGVLLSEFLPTKPYTIEPEKIADSVFRKLGAQKQQLAYERGVLKNEKPLTRSAVEDIVAGQVEGLVKIAHTAMRFKSGLMELGVSERYFYDKLKGLLPKTDAALVMRAGKIRTPRLTVPMRRSLMELTRDFPDVENRLPYWRDAMREFGRIQDINE